ncbi:MAG: hypothetical protein AAGH99_10560 [Planctomycetota bacterium]
MRRGMLGRGLVLGAVLFGTVNTVGVSGAEPLNLLFFGNSFTQGFTVANNDDETPVPDIVRDLATADGYATPFIVADLLGGQDLDYHLGQVNNQSQNNVANSGLGAGDTWDFVVMQGLSTESTSVFGDGTFEQDALALYQAVEGHRSGNGAGVTGVLYQTWARGPGNSFYTGSNPDYPGGPAEMQADVRAGYESARSVIASIEGDDAALIAPVGDAFESLGFALDFSQDAALNLYDTDIFHASNQGTLLAALVIYRTIYGEDVSDLVYGDLGSSLTSLASASQWEILTTAADLVVIPEPAVATVLLLASVSLFGRFRR